MLQFEEIIKRIAETYREDAERLNCDTCGEVFDCYGYSTNELKEEIIYSYAYDFEPEEEFKNYDDGSITLDNGEDISYKKVVANLRRYRF